MIAKVEISGTKNGTVQVDLPVASKLKGRKMLAEIDKRVCEWMEHRGDWDSWNLLSLLFTDPDHQA